MSYFYGMVQGNSGPATRQGSESGGITASAQSYSGSVITRLEKNDEVIMARIDVSDDSATWGNIVLNIPLRDLTQCDQLVPYLNGVPLSDYPIEKNEAEHE